MAIDVRTDPQVGEPAVRPRPAAATETPGARAPFVALDDLRVGTPVLCADGRCGWIDPATGAPQAQVVRARRFFGPRRVVPTSWISALSAYAVTLSATRAELAGRPEHRTDQWLLADVRSRLLDDDPIRALGLRHASLEVADGVVTLRGHVPSPRPSGSISTDTHDVVWAPWPGAPGRGRSREGRMAPFGFRPVGIADRRRRARGEPCVRASWSSPAGARRTGRAGLRRRGGREAEPGDGSGDQRRSGAVPQGGNPAARG
jgi:hypothetical protein